MVEWGRFHESIEEVNAMIFSNGNMVYLQVESIG